MVFIDIPTIKPMTQEHPLNPPSELVEKWDKEAIPAGTHSYRYPAFIAERAAQWGADQELEACCEWLEGTKSADWDYPAKLRTVRRPKPPSLKEQALEALNAVDPFCTEADSDTIRRALEQLPD